MNFAKAITRFVAKAITVFVAECFAKFFGHALQSLRSALARFSRLKAFVLKNVTRTFFLTLGSNPSA